ncbi:MAG TPA: FecR domain-containing protein [Rhizomicrobium sp.]|nr:FecR domain-containing protein [Rhizomicrobium sp.]
MSEARDTAGTAREIDARAAFWVERRYFGEWTEDDQSALDAWLAQSVAHRVAFVRLDTGWRQTERLVALRPFKPEQTEPRARNWTLRAAAALAIAAMLGLAGMHYVSQPRDRIYATGVGGHEVIAFADGSKIELNTDTVLRARMTTKERTVWLDKGEAFFRVHHNAANPFVVIASGHRVTDLGTSFLVRRDRDRLEVALLDGRVRFAVAGAHAQSSLLKPGDDVVATAESVSLTHESRGELAGKLIWRRGLVVFKDTALAEAVRELDRYNNEKLVVADPAIAHRKISGTIPVGDIDGFIRVVRDVLGLHVQNDGNEVVITR